MCLQLKSQKQYDGSLGNHVSYTRSCSQRELRPSQGFSQSSLFWLFIRPLNTPYPLRLSAFHGPYWWAGSWDQELQWQGCKSSTECFKSGLKKDHFFTSVYTISLSSSGLPALFALRAAPSSVRRAGLWESAGAVGSSSSQRLGRIELESPAIDCSRTQLIDQSRRGQVLNQAHDRND